MAVVVQFGLPTLCPFCQWFFTLCNGFINYVFCRHWAVRNPAGTSLDSSSLANKQVGLIAPQKKTVNFHTVFYISLASLNTCVLYTLCTIHFLYYTLCVLYTFYTIHFVYYTLCVLCTLYFYFFSSYFVHCSYITILQSCRGHIRSYRSNLASLK